MCLAIPGQVRDIYEANGARMGKVNFGGIVKEVCLEYIPEIKVGEYAIVHVGFAISKVDEASALETLEVLRQLGELEEGLADDRRAPDEPAAGVECAPSGSRGTATPGSAQASQDENGPDGHNRG